MEEQCEDPEAPGAEGCSDEQRTQEAKQRRRQHEHAQVARPPTASERSVTTPMHGNANTHKPTLATY